MVSRTGLNRALGDGGEKLESINEASAWIFIMIAHVGHIIYLMDYRYNGRLDVLSLPIM